MFFPIHAIRFVYGDLTFTVPIQNVFRVVRREEFDTALARLAQERGIALHEGEALLDVVRDQDAVHIQTNSASYRAQVLIGADGANSVVRQKLGLVRWDRISRLIEVLTPVSAAHTPEFVEHTAVFDFTPMAYGVQGYYWDFPSFKQGVATMNRGIFDSRVHPQRPRVNLQPVFETMLARRGVERHQWHGHPERWFDPRVKHSTPHVLLAGDAAGTEPLFGEGISHALDFGMRAANEAMRALQRNDFSFADYERRIAWSALGRRLIVKRILAHLLYGNRGEWFYRLGWYVLRAIFGK